MARFGRMFALGSGDGKTVPTKTSPSSLQKLWRTLSAEKKRVPLRFFTYPVKSTRVLVKEIELWERCKTTAICGMKSMTNTANVENAGSINNPPGCLSTRFCWCPDNNSGFNHCVILLKWWFQFLCLTTVAHSPTGSSTREMGIGEGTNRSAQIVLWMLAKSWTNWRMWFIPLYPIFYRLSTIHCGGGFLNHPQYLFDQTILIGRVDCMLLPQMGDTISIFLLPL